jgi:hypothetical protein
MRIGTGRVAELCLVTDLDRTCYRTGIAGLKIGAAIEEVMGIESASLNTTVAERRKAGQTTQIVDLLKDKGASPRNMEDVFQKFVDTTTPEEVIYPDVDPFFTAVDESELVTAVLLTMGPGLQQEAKICTTGLQGRVPYVIADPDTMANAEEKDWQIKSWVTKNGIIVPRLTPPQRWQGGHPHDARANAAILIEDKYKAFGMSTRWPRAGDRPGIGGFWVDRPEERDRGLTPGEKEALPGVIEYTEGLSEITVFVRSPQELLRHPMVQRWAA